MRFCSIAFCSVRTTVSWPMMSLNLCGRYLRARAWYDIGGEYTASDPLGRAQAELCHAGNAPYRCFLPDLTRFGTPAAQDPGSSQRADQSLTAVGARIL